MSQKHSLYLIRHAQSEFNIAQMKAKNSNLEVRRDEDLNVKFDPNLVDCSISPYGYQQVDETSVKLKDINVRLVITSPLRRCLQTTRGLFKHHKSRPHVIVWPILKEILLSACDMSDELDNIKKEFPNYDFSLLDNFPCPELWLLYTLKNEKVARDLIKELFRRYPKKEDALKNAKVFIAEKLKQIYPNNLESQIDINKRAIEAKAALREKLKELKGDEAIVVVAHSRFLEAFTAERYEEDGTPVNAKWLSNCEVLPYDLN